MATVKKDLGGATAYAAAVAGGYQGTKAEFEELLGNIAEDLSEIENLTVTVTTLPAGSSATASYADGVLTLGIPRGDTGATPDISIGTVTTGAAGSSAAASITGTPEHPVLNLTIPQGLKGDAGNGDMLADDFSASASYSAGDYVIYNGSLYRFTAAHAAGAWSGSDATAVQIAEDVSQLNSALTAIFTSWEQGTINYQNGEEAPSTTACRTVGYFVPSETITVKITNTNSQAFGLRRYNNDGTYISSANISSESSFDAVRGEKYRLICSSTGNPSSITAKFEIINSDKNSFAHAYGEIDALDDATWDQKKEYTLHRGWFIYGYRINKSSNTAYEANAMSAVTFPFWIQENTILRVSGDYTMRVLTRATNNLSVFKVVANEVSDTDVRVDGGQYLQIMLTYTGDEESLPLDVNTALTLICNTEQSEYFDNQIIKLDKSVNIENLYRYSDRISVLTYQANGTTGYMTYPSAGSSYNMVSQFYNEEQISLVWAAELTKECYIHYADNTVAQLVNGVPLTIPAKSTWRIIIPNYFSSNGGLLRQLFLMQTTRTTDNTDQISRKQAVDFDMGKTWLTSCKIHDKPTGFSTGTMQDADRYGDYVVMTRSGVHSLYVVDLTTNAVVKTAELSEATMGHANEVSFTRQFLNAGDNLPLLLVSHFDKVSGEDLVHVYHIANDFTVTLANTFKVQAESSGATGFVYDPATNALCSIGGNGTGKILISVFNLPYDIDFSTVEIVEDDLIVSRINWLISGIYFQGAAIYDGRLFVVTTNTSLVDSKVYVFDVYKAQLINVLVDCLDGQIKNNETNGCYINQYSGEYTVCVVVNSGITCEISMLKRGYNTRTANW